MKIGVVGAVIAALFLSTAAIAKNLVQVPVDKDFSEGNISINSGFGTAYEYMIDVILLDDQIAVCGVGKFPDPSTQVFAKGLMRKATLTINGKVFLKDMSFFAKVKKRDDLTKATATCQLTGFAPPKSRTNDISLNIGGGIFRY